MGRALRRTSSLAVAAVALTALRSSDAHQETHLRRRAEGISPEEESDLPPDPIDNLLLAQFSPNPYEGRNSFDLIVSGELSLIGLYASPSSLAPDDEEADFSKIRADFCKVDYGIQKDDPSLVPTHRDVTGLSDHCSDHLVSYPLSEVVAACREYDSGSDSRVHSMTMKGFLFHQPKSGSSVLSNAIAAARPETVRVISESDAVGNVLRACKKNRCDPAKHAELLQEVLYLHSRTTDPSETDLYVRFDPEGTSRLPLVRSAYPSAKWMYVSRDPDVVLSKVMAGRDRHALCVKNKRNPSPGLEEYVSDRGGMRLGELSEEETCAGLLGSMTRTAWSEHESSRTGLMVDYDSDLTTSEGVRSILRDYLEIDLDDDAIARIDDQRKKRGRGELWKQETVAVSQEVRDANALFLNSGEAAVAEDVAEQGGQLLENN